MNIFQRLFAKKKKVVQTGYKNYASSGGGSYSRQDDLLDPLNIASPLSPLNPLGIYHNNYDGGSSSYEAPSHDSGTTHHDHGSHSYDSSSYDSGSSSSDSSSYDSGSSSSDSSSSSFD